jgi:hypothetical protein
MLYKTMVLEIIQLHPDIYDRLRSQRKLLPELERYATELKARHDAWKAMLTQAQPGSSERQVASQALEIALKELTDHFASASAPKDDQPTSNSAATDIQPHHMPTA